jgi:predicted RNase H-like HicB family nuclease
MQIFEPTAVFRKEKDDGYYVFCREVDGVFSQGDTMEEAREMIADALNGIVQAVLDDELDNYFIPAEYKPLKGDIIEPVRIDPVLQAAVTLRIAREKAALTQKKAAELAGLKQQALSRYERGKVEPSAGKFFRLLHLYAA